MELETITISEDKTILDALKKLNRILYIADLSSLILFVTDEQESVIGSLTDGDIRRYLIQEADLNGRVGNICNRNFSFEFEPPGFLDLSPYRKRRLHILPILDENKKLLRVIELDKTRAVLPLECMIMAGGRGKRLSPLTDTVPKPMLPLGGKPIIEHNIDRLISYGIEKIYIAVKYLGEQIREYFGDGSKKGISITYIWEEEPLGTAGALSQVENFGSEHVLLINSDLFTNADLEVIYKDLVRTGAEMAVASTEYKIDVPYAVFETEESKVLEFKEKPSFVYYSNAGIYILKKELIDRIPKNTYFDITDLMDELIREQGKLVHSPIRGYWIDIGKPVDYKQAQEFIKHAVK